MMSNNRYFKMVLSALFLGLALVLPFLTGQVPVVGAALCPMHFPVILCGFFCGPWYALAVGMVAPLLRLVLFGMPPIYPTGVGMCLELATYGCVTGLLYNVLPKRKVNIYVSLVAAMLAGRAVWGISRAIMYGVAGEEFGMALFISGAFANSVPGIALQIILIPMIVMLLYRNAGKNK